MVRWGDFEQVDLKLLRRVAEAVQHQQRVAGEAMQGPPFSPSSVIGEHAIAQGLRIQTTAGQLVALAGVGVSMFLLGYHYRCAEAGETASLSAGLDDTPPGGAND